MKVRLLKIINSGPAAKIILLMCLVIAVAYNASLPKTDPDIEDVVNKTEVVRYFPRVDDYESRGGSCWTNSIPLPFRSGAWRCSSLDQIFDPCFEVGDKIICDQNPADEGGEFELKIDQDDRTKMEDLAVQLSESGEARFDWTYQLDNGAVCILMQGTAGYVDGLAYYYECSDNSILVGDVDKTNDLWRVKFGKLNDSRDGFESIEDRSIVRVWK